MAKLYWNHCEKIGKWLPNQIFSDKGWTYQYNMSKQSRLKKKYIYEDLFGDSTRDHWIHKQQIAVDQIIHLIDWDNCKCPIKRLPFSQKLWISKHASRHCAVGRMTKIQKHREHSMCPRCLQDNKTTEHVLLCKHFETLSKKLDIKLVTMETSLDIRRTIIHKITNWHRRQRITA
jgi:hypothetical protein